MEGTEILSTEEMLAYVIPEGYECLTFLAQWSGDDADYYSEVVLDGYGGEFVVKDFWWENDEKIENEQSVSDWGFRLRICEEGIAEQTSEWFEFITDPVKEDADFEGWAEFKRRSYVNEWGDPEEELTLISETLYTTEEMLAKEISENDIVYAAKWSDLDLEDYFQAVCVVIDTQDGNMKVQNGEGSFETDYYEHYVRKGWTLGADNVEITDLVYWDEDRDFEGWMLCAKEVKEDNEDEWEYVQVAGTELFTTQELISYTASGDALYFVAQWSGDDADYYSQVDLDGYGGEFTLKKFWWEDDKKVEETV